MDELLVGIYLNPAHPASFGSAENLYHAARAKDPHVTRDIVKEWLSGQDAYTLNKPVSRKFPRSRLISPGLFIQNDIDLADVSNMAKDNDGVRFLLVSIDSLSRKLYVKGLKSKSGTDVVQGLETLWGSDPFPRVIRSDSGKEWLNRHVQKFFKEKEIFHFTTNNEPKAHLAERVIKSLRGRLHRFIAHRQSEHYIEHLDSIVFAYNNSVHSSIGIAPADVNRDNERAIWWTQYWPKSKQRRRKKFIFKAGDHVRISYLRSAFTRGYDYNFSGEIFKVSSRTRHDDIPVYKLVDMADEPITGTFYTEELIKVAPKETWKVEKILKRRKRKGHPAEVLIRWQFFGPKFDSWVPADSVVDL